MAEQLKRGDLVRPKQYKARYIVRLVQGELVLVTACKARRIRESWCRAEDCIKILTLPGRS